VTYGCRNIVLNLIIRRLTKKRAIRHGTSSRCGDFSFSDVGFSPTKEFTMTHKEPVAELAAPFSSPDATLTPWTHAREQLEQAEIFWLSTVRPDGRPHVTPLLAVWQEDALYFCTGETERKAKNIAQNTHCILTTGCNSLKEGLDLVIEGDAVQESNHAILQRIADCYEAKYGSEWRFTVQDGAFSGDGNVALVYKVVPTTAFGFGRGATYSQTRWRF
jgi:uncharacterized pyridoxamine 5'-phosphate oxidase family protein